ncbi:MAG: hypothetical protein CM15mP74_31330 [Halieaceae bacterium]|nr:MAG: hypothetical protein CM15mP74_31330 [Halieaceae bacterium]
MGTGAITEYVDVAQIALYAFWILFFILVGYLHREGKREGWPSMSSGELRTGVGHASTQNVSSRARSG